MKRTLFASCVFVAIAICSRVLAGITPIFSGTNADSSLQMMHKLNFIFESFLVKKLLTLNFLY